MGTSRYASLNSHRGIELSRRDDLESLAYVLIYLAKGTLPWANLQIKDYNSKNLAIRILKEQTSSEILCENLPIEFAKFLKYSREIPFKERPSYSYLYKILK